MKKCISLLSVLALMILLSSCDLVDKEPSLPPATQKGANTFGCLVNGKIWIPEGKPYDDILNPYYDPNSYGGLLNVVASRYKDDNKQIVAFFVTDLQGKRTYRLNDYEKSFGQFSDRNTGCFYDNMPDVYSDGTLTITHFDLTSGIISGTFGYTIAYADCDTVKITDGRFDLKL